jgi:SAM-dependent methyltransferase
MWSVDPELEQRALTLRPEVRSKFHDLPSYLHMWMAPHGGLAGRRVLDFGCGSGTSAAGIALLGGAELVVGVDINPESRACESFLREALGQDGLPPNLRFEEIRPGETTSMDDIDIVFSWSVFEHVDERILADVLDALVAKVRPGGYFFVQISPLYFSPEGGHLWAIGYGAWEHLLSQSANVEADIAAAPDLSAETKAGLVAMFRTLNRITADDLLERFEAAGLTLLREQRDRTDREPPVCLTRAYTMDALTTYQIVALFRKPD